MQIQPSQPSVYASDTSAQSRSTAYTVTGLSLDTSFDLFAEIFSSIANSTSTPASAGPKRVGDESVPPPFDPRAADQTDEDSEEVDDVDDTGSSQLAIAALTPAAVASAPIANVDEVVVNEKIELNVTEANPVNRSTTEEFDTDNILATDGGKLEVDESEVPLTADEALAQTDVTRNRRLREPVAIDNQSTAIANATDSRQTTEAVESNVEPSADKLANKSAGLADEISEPTELSGRRDRGERRNQDGKTGQRKTESIAASQRDGESSQIQSAGSKLAEQFAAPELTQAVASSPQLEQTATASSASIANAALASVGTTSKIAAESTARQAAQAPTTTAIGGVSGRNDAALGSSRSSEPIEQSRQGELADRARLVHRVAKAFQRLGLDGGQVRLRMHPEELGGIQLAMNVSGRNVEVTVTADNAQAASLLQEHLPELRQRLESQGLNVERIDVRTQNDDQGRPSGQNAFDQQQHHGQEQSSGRDGVWTRRDAVATKATLPAATASTPPMRSNRALDLRL